MPSRFERWRIGHAIKPRWRDRLWNFFFSYKVELPPSKPALMTHEALFKLYLDWQTKRAYKDDKSP